MRIVATILIVFAFLSCTNPEPRVIITRPAPVYIAPSADNLLRTYYHSLDMRKIGRKVNRSFKQRPVREIEYLIAMSDRYGVSPATALALLYQESDGTQSARSPVGALGLMQIMPKSHYAGPAVHLVTDPQLNIRLGVRYLKLCRRTTGSDWHAVQAYNTGHGAWLEGIRSGKHAKRVFRIRGAIQKELERIHRNHQEKQAA